MHPKMLKAMKAKVKRPVDPNAPPRPNLLTHEKKIKEMGQQHQNEIAELRQKVYNLERKLQRQTDYLDALHNRVVMKK